MRAVVRVGLVGLVLGGGSFDCYDGGCAALYFAAAGWPVGTAIGATFMARRLGFSAGAWKMIAYSALSTRVGVMAVLSVDRISEWQLDSCRQSPADVPGPRCGGGLNDWVYAVVGPGTQLATLSLLGHFTPTPVDRGVSVSAYPLLRNRRSGIATRIVLSTFREGAPVSQPRR